MADDSQLIIGILIKDPGALERQVFPIRQTLPLTIGRAPDNHIPLSDVRAKRHHCMLYAEGELVYLVPGSPLHSNTWINGTEVRDRCQLMPGDVIIIGGTVFRFDQPASSGREDSVPERGEA